MIKKSKLLSTWLGMCLLILPLLGCANLGKKTALHGFEFDAGHDSPGVTVLRYKYGDSKNFGTQGGAELNPPRGGQGMNTFGGMLVGDFLYVKWRWKETGQIYEENVDLKNRLPKDMEDKKIYFHINGDQLYVFLIYPDKRLPQEPINGPSTYSGRKVITIYPAGSPIFAYKKSF